MASYYNENDPYAAQWLRNLIAAGLIADGEVDERSIKDIKGSDLNGFTQAHFFAGIGGWPIALRLAGWSDDRPVWTGSCPCQPFSNAGKRKGTEDERHLWPIWFNLIRERGSPVIFGEQVAAAIGGGWLDAVFADLEGQGYACGAAVLPACGVGAPHIRQRLWFVAESSHRGWRTREPHVQKAGFELHEPWGSEVGGLMAHSYPPGRSEQRRGGLLDGERPAQRDDADGCSGVGDARSNGRQARFIEPGVAREPRQEGYSPQRPGSLAWADCDYLPCTDGKARPVEPGTFPLAHGVQRRASKLRAYGNAIVPQTAAEFIKAFVGL